MTLVRSCHGATKVFVEVGGRGRGAMECYGVLWSATECYGVLWSAMECYGVL